MNCNTPFILSCLSTLIAAAALGSASPQAAPGTIAKSIGVIKAINGNSIALTPASGPDVVVTVQPNARILRLAPGDKDLKNATPLQLSDLHAGDTIRARGMSSGSATSIDALEIVVITRAAVQAVSDQIRQDWQKRGLGGTVSLVDSAAGTITISSVGFAGSKTTTVRTSKNTVFRRYAPDSIKFEEAKPGTLQEILPGDQLRARGDHSADGSEFTAEEIVTGSFRNIAGTVNSVDGSAGILSVQDLLSKKTVQVKITADSQLHKLPPELAQHIAMRLKARAVMPGAGGSSSAGNPARTSQETGAPEARTMPGAVGANRPAMGPGMRSGGAPDFQQMLSYMPAVALGDLHKGDAVMLVATQGTASSPSTAITLLSGVEPILEAAPSASQAMMLAPWSLGAAPPGGEAGP